LLCLPVYRLSRSPAGSLPGERTEVRSALPVYALGSHHREMGLFKPHIDLALVWSSGDSGLLGALLVSLLAAGVLVWIRFTWRERRMYAAVALLMVVSIFAALSRDDRNEQHFSGPAQDRLGVEEPSFSFVIVGDFGVGNDQEREVSAAIRDWVGRHGADAFISAGDTIYPVGSPRYFERSWFEPYGWLEDAGMLVIGTLGNHDYAAGDRGKAVMELLGMPRRWFETKIGDARIIVLDANQPNDPQQQRWLERRLQVSPRQWTIVVLHQPPYSCSRSGDRDVREAWTTLFDRADVDLVVSGHEHNYQRFSSATSATYVITGGGGDALYRVGECSFAEPRLVASDDQNFHFLVVSGSTDRFSAQVIALDGSTLDHFSL
jgi:predicted phosphodiesterase